MPHEEVTELLGEWEGYRVGWSHRYPAGEDGKPPQVWIELIRRDTAQMVCSGCGVGRENRQDVVDERAIQ